MLVKVPYSSLSKLNADQQALFNSYTLLKAQTNDLLSKNGFITKSEVQKVADSNHESKKNLLRKLKVLTENGYIQKNKWGYTLTSHKTINNNLSLKSKRNKKGIEYIPFSKIELPRINDVKVIELIRLYLLIQQIYSQRQFRLNVIKSERRKRPEKFALSIDKICMRGNYKNKRGENSKMLVWRMINQLENAGLLTVGRGKKNDTGNNECNKYSLKPLSAANWNNIYRTKLSAFEKLFSEPVTKKKVVLEKVEKEKKVTEYNGAERIFYKCLDAGLQDILVDEGLLSRKAYHSFGSTKGRKVTKNMLSELLIYNLNDPELRNILFTVLKPENIWIEETEGDFYDTRLETYCYDRFRHYKYNKVSLINDGGNYNDYAGVVLESKKVKDEQMKNKIYGIRSL